MGHAAIRRGRDVPSALRAPDCGKKSTTHRTHRVLCVLSVTMVTVTVTVTVMVTVTVTVTVTVKEYLLVDCNAMYVSTLFASYG
jgi:hypothetical protein